MTRRIFIEGAGAFSVVQLTGCASPAGGRPEASGRTSRGSRNRQRELLHGPLPDAACEVWLHRGCRRREESLSARQAIQDFAQGKGGGPCLTQPLLPHHWGQTFGVSLGVCLPNILHKCDRFDLSPRTNGKSTCSETRPMGAGRKCETNRSSSACGNATCRTFQHFRIAPRATQHFQEALTGNGGAW